MMAEWGCEGGGWGHKRGFSPLEKPAKGKNTVPASFTLSGFTMSKQELNKQQRGLIKKNYAIKTTYEIVMTGGYEENCVTHRGSAKCSSDKPLPCYFINMCYCLKGQR